MKIHKMDSCTMLIPYLEYNPVFYAKSINAADSSETAVCF